MAENSETPKPLRVLVVDDNEINRMVMGAILEIMAAHIVEATDGAQAVQACAHAEFDVVLMDIQMPVQDGLSATREIRKCEAAQGRSPTPILAISANAMTKQVEDALAAGCNAFLSKPVTAVEVLGAIGAALEDADRPAASPSRRLASLR